MELHAWLNPYRVTSAAKQTLPKNHLYHKHPERFLRYEGKLYFDPGLPANRDFIVQVVSDIVKRYDVDGIHFDDYFYPYPGKTEFPDNASYRKYGGKMKRADWRRSNVDRLIEAVYGAIHGLKPWVRFGVSPFGIWRNKKSDSRGSETAGLENYDALYADVLLWAERGWVDYLLGARTPSGRLRCTGELVERECIVVPSVYRPGCEPQHGQTGLGWRSRPA